MLLLLSRAAIALPPSVPSAARDADGVHAGTGDGALPCVRNDAAAAAAAATHHSLPLLSPSGLRALQIAITRLL